ncbi:MAG: enoyl-CoA hydratase/isomerase family protein [Oscillospiraceae bacterium]
MVESNIATLQAEGSTGILTICNGKKNLLTEPEFIDTDVFENWIENHPELNSLIITGAGRHFSHGADVSLFQSAQGTKEISVKLERARGLLRKIEQLPLVTVAAVNGGCFGGGLEIALSCQFRICARRAFFGLTEIMHGVVPGMGGMERLYRLVGKEKALMMCLSGEMLSASDAEKCGLVTAVAEIDCLTEAKEFVKTLTADKTILQVRSIVDTINRAQRGETDPSKGKFEAVLQEILDKKVETD